MSQDNIYEKRWEFRRKDGDFDTSSDDKGSSSSKGRTLDKSNPVDEEETSHQHELNPPKEVAKCQRKSAKKGESKRPKKNSQNCGPRTSKTKKGSNKNNLHGLEKHVKVLVKELNTSREGFMKWMEEEMEKLVAGNVTSKPSKNTISKRKIGSCKKSSKKTNPNGSSTRVEMEKNKAIQTPTVLALADNNSKAKSSAMVLSIENTNKAIVASNYLNLANLNPRPLAENYLVKVNARSQPVVLNGQQQQQSGGYYQGISLQSDRDFSVSMGSYGGFPSASHTSFNGGFNVHNLGLSGSEALAQDNNFPSLRMMRFFGGSNGV
ncbi:hypothetical protein V2J09_020240 [Rumex salicifolius]